MPGIWFALRKSLPCKSQPSDTPPDSEPRNNVGPVQRRMPRRSASVGCLANLKGVIHGSRRHNKRPSICSPKAAICGAENPSPADGNEIVLDNLRPARQTSGPIVKGGPQSDSRSHSVFGRALRRSLSENSRRCHGSLASPFCQTCGLQHKCSAAIEEPHRLSKHGVSELVEGDSSRKIVEIICQTREEYTDNEANIECTKIERILRVHNMQNILNWFEEYREMIKTKASKQFDNYEENPRCLADGNELLMFYATTVSCSLGTSGASGLCKLSHCGACRILRNGVFTRRDFVGRVGIFAASNSDRALRYARDQEGQYKKNKALFVCRVIAGKVHSPLKKIEQGFSVGSGFDSLAWKVGQNMIAEELILLNPRALLPCFVAIYNI